MAAHGIRFCPTGIMGYVLTIVVLHLLTSVTADSKNCQTTVHKNQSATLRCTEQTNLMILETIRANTRTIEISESNIADVPGHAFAKFGATLVTLDLHQSGIQTIDSMAFVGLTKLESLILWGNKLRNVPRQWFANTYNLRTLDLSFNSIDVIDYAVFQLLPNLENFYFDYNQIKFIDYSMFAYLRSLKTVKFEKNPLNWGYHALLTWQLENQRVKYTEQWENWGWMNVMIKECTESGYGEIPKDTVLDCLVAKLLDFTHHAFSTVAEAGNICTAPARQLVRCMRPKNATGNTDNETVRKILEDYTAILTPMTNSLVRFTVRNSTEISGCVCQPIITIYRLEGPRLRIRIGYSETIGYLKQRLAKLLHERCRKWRPERMRLWIHGHYLEDNRTLSDYNLTSEDRVTLLLDDRY